VKYLNKSHKMTKRILIYMFIFCMFNSCAKRNIDVPLDVSIVITDKINDYITHENDTITIYFCDITLVNRTDTVFSFWTMNCSYWSQLIFRPDSLIDFNIVGCDGNYPKKVQLLPNEKYLFKEVLKVIDYQKLCQERNLKLGFILDERFNNEKENRKTQKSDTIWSKKPIRFNW